MSTLSTMLDFYLSISQSGNLTHTRLERKNGGQYVGHLKVFGLKMKSGIFFLLGRFDLSDMSDD